MKFSTDKKLVILGFGGHTRSIVDVALTVGYTDFLFVDSNAFDNEKYLEFDVVKTIPSTLNLEECYFFCASGSNNTRRKQIEFLIDKKLKLISIISPFSTVAKNSNIAAGVFVGHHAHVGPKTKINHGCIINTAAVVEHDCCIGPFTHVSVNATLAGKVSVGESCFVGAGATIIDSISIGNFVNLGAGAICIRNIARPGTYVGSPATLINKKNVEVS